MNASVVNGSVFGSKFNKVNWVNSKKNYKVYVSNKADLTITGITKNIDEKKNVVSLSTVIKNIGTKSSNSIYLKVWYDNKKLNNYSKSVKVKSLKPGKFSTVNISFKVPYKYRNQIKNIKIDSKNQVNESIESNNHYTFK